MPALDGMRILDLTQYEAGPSCTQALALLGAEVVKVEKPGEGEPGRTLGFGQDNSPYFWNWNSNKRSVAIDLTSEAGHALLLDLIPHYDVLVENYGPGVLEKLGLGHEKICADHPTLIYASVKGFGMDGPRANYKSFDMIAQAAAGAFSVTGDADGRPMRPGPTMGDTGTGMQLGIAILAAYVQRQRTGQGQFIEISMQEAMTYYMRTMIAIGQGFSDRAAPRTGTGMSAEIDMYPCAPGGPNDYIYIAVATDRMFDALCKVIGRPDMAGEERFRSRASRVANGAEIAPAIRAWSETQTKDAAMKALADVGVPCSAIQDTADLFRDPHLLARDFIKTVDHPTEGQVDLLGFPARLSASHVEMQAAPLLGEATEEILAKDLGLDAETLARLEAQGTIAGTKDS